MHRVFGSSRIFLQIKQTAKLSSLFYFIRRYGNKLFFKAVVRKSAYEFLDLEISLA